jgi:hypothetical protein
MPFRQLWKTSFISWLRRLPRGTAWVGFGLFLIGISYVHAMAKWGAALASPVDIALNVLMGLPGLVSLSLVLYSAGKLSLRGAALFRERKKEGKALFVGFRWPEKMPFAVKVLLVFAFFALSFPWQKEALCGAGSRMCFWFREDISFLSIALASHYVALLLYEAPEYLVRWIAAPKKYRYRLIAFGLAAAGLGYEIVKNWKGFADFEKSIFCYLLALALFFTLLESLFAKIFRR